MNSRNKYPRFIALNFKKKAVFGLVGNKYYNLDSWKSYGYGYGEIRYLTVYNNKLKKLVNKLNSDTGSQLSLECSVERANHKIAINADDLINLAFNSEGKITLYALEFTILSLKDKAEIKMDNVVFTSSMFDIKKSYRAAKNEYQNLKDRLEMRNLPNLINVGSILQDDLDNCEHLIMIEDLLSEPYLKPTSAPNEILLTETNIKNGFAEPKFVTVDFFADLKEFLNSETIGNETTASKADSNLFTDSHQEIRHENDDQVETWLDYEVDNKGELSHNLLISYSDEAPFEPLEPVTDQVVNQNEVGNEFVEADFFSDWKTFLESEAVCQVQIPSIVSHNFFNDKLQLEDNSGKEPIDEPLSKRRRRG